jgi:hypothetical protein
VMVHMGLYAHLAGAEERLGHHQLGPADLDLETRSDRLTLARSKQLRRVGSHALAQRVERTLESLLERDARLPSELVLRLGGVERDALHLAGTRRGVLSLEARLM